MAIISYLNSRRESIFCDVFGDLAKYASAKLSRRLNKRSGDSMTNRLLALISNEPMETEESGEDHENH